MQRIPSLLKGLFTLGAFNTKWYMI
jgi:hypothetical protein